MFRAGSNVDFVILDSVLLIKCRIHIIMQWGVYDLHYVAGARARETERERKRERKRERVGVSCPDNHYDYIMANRERGRERESWCFMPRQPLRLYHGEQRERERERVGVSCPDNHYDYIMANRERGRERELVFHAQTTITIISWRTEREKRERVGVSCPDNHYDYIMANRERERERESWCFMPRQPLRLYHGEQRERERERGDSTFKWFTKNRLERVLISTYTTRYTKIMYTLAWKCINSQSHQTTRPYIHTTQITRLHRLWAGGCWGGGGSRTINHIHK